MKVLETSNYGLFKHRLDNRDVSVARVNKIQESIEKVGYVGAPIVVNEKHEVIDGQARLKALERLKMPVPYVVIEGIGANECRALNAAMKNWSLKDYVKSYSFENDSYKYLFALMNEFQKYVGVRAILSAITGSVEGGDKFKTVKDGTCVISVEAYEKARASLAYASRFYSPLNRMNAGARSYYYIALCFCYSHDEIDKEKLFDHVTKYISMLNPAVTVLSAVEQLEHVYNYRNRDKLFFVGDYKRSLEIRRREVNTERAYKSAATVAKRRNK